MRIYEDLRVLQRRLTVVQTVLAVVLVLLAGYFWHLQVLRGKYYRELAENNRLRMVPIPAPRGQMFDRRGRVLAIDEPAQIGARFPRTLFAIRGRERYRIIQALHAYPHTASAMPFGDELHYSDAREDLGANLPLHYGRSGYLDFVVTGDSLVVDQQTGKAKLLITVEEGPQYLLSSFDIAGRLCVTTRRTPPQKRKARWLREQNRPVRPPGGSARALNGDEVLGACAAKRGPPEEAAGQHETELFAIGRPENVRGTFRSGHFGKAGFRKPSDENSPACPAAQDRRQFPAIGRDGEHQSAVRTAKQRPAVGHRNREAHRLIRRRRRARRTDCGKRRRDDGGADHGACQRG